MCVCVCVHVHTDDLIVVGVCVCMRGTLAQMCLRHMGGNDAVMELVVTYV